MITTSMENSTLILLNKITDVVNQFIVPVDNITFTTIESGHINATYKVSVQNGEKSSHYLLQKLNTKVFSQPQQVMENIDRCARFLNSTSIDYPYEILTPLKTLNCGEYLYVEETSHWRMFDFIDNTCSLDKISSADQAYTIGKAFGTFLFYINQDEVAPYYTTIPDFHNFTKRYTNFQSFLKNDLDRALSEEEEKIVNAVDQVADEYLALEKIEFPVRLAHHDTKANNVLLDNITLSPKCIIDLDTLMPGSIFSDFGDLLRTVLNPFEEDEFLDPETEIDIHVFNKLTEGFLLSVRQLLTDVEKAYLIQGGKKIILLQIVRFLEDHLKHDIYYQVRYKGHNLTRATSQLNLFNAIERSGVNLR